MRNEPQLRSSVSRALKQAGVLTLSATLTVLPVMSYATDLADTPLASGPIDSQVPIWQSRRACRSAGLLLARGSARASSASPCSACASAKAFACPEQTPSTQ